jgi:transposase InsO family protein
MRQMGLQGAVGGKSIKTPVSDAAAPCPRDRVNQPFTPRPNALWVSDFTCVATWSGFVSVAFVIDAYARRIGGWRVSRSARAEFVLDALEQALHGGSLSGDPASSTPATGDVKTCRSRTPSASPRPASSRRSAVLGTRPTNALAKTLIGLFKAEVIHRRGPWRSFESVEFATLEWVDWYTNRRLLESIGSIPPAEAEAAYDAKLEVMPMAA